MNNGIGITYQVEGPNPERELKILQNKISGIPIEVRSKPGLTVIANLVRPESRIPSLADMLSDDMLDEVEGKLQLYVFVELIPDDGVSKAKMADFLDLSASSYDEVLLSINNSSAAVLARRGSKYDFSLFAFH